MLHLHKLDAYRVSTEFLNLVLEIGQTLPRGIGDDADQLARAAKSIIRNIVEGAGRWSRADKSKHYSIARGEAMECVGCVDVMKAQGVIDRERHARATELLQRMVSMITGLIKRCKPGRWVALQTGHMGGTC